MSQTFLCDIRQICNYPTIECELLYLPQCDNNMCWQEGIYSTSSKCCKLSYYIYVVIYFLSQTYFKKKQKTVTLALPKSKKQKNN